MLTRLDRGPLVGRSDALDRLRGVWQRVTAGEPAIVAIAGEAGAGKTRLISAFALEARERGAAVLAGRCFEDAVAPYGAFTEVLRQHSTWLEPPSDWVAAELGRLVPELASEAFRLSAIRTTRDVGFLRRSPSC